MRLSNSAKGRYRRARTAIVAAFSKRGTALHDEQPDSGHAAAVDTPAYPDASEDGRRGVHTRGNQRETHGETEELTLILDQVTTPHAPSDLERQHLVAVARRLSQEAVSDKELQAQLRRSQLGRLSRGALLVVAFLTAVTPLSAAVVGAILAVNGDVFSGIAAAYHTFKGNISPELAIGVVAALFTGNAAINVALAVNTSGSNRLDQIYEASWRADLTKVAGAAAITSLVMGVMYTIGGSARNVWFASEFAAEIGVRNYPRLAVFSGDPRGAVHARVQQRSAPCEDLVGGDEVGDLPAGDGRGDFPGGGCAQVAGGRVDGDRDPPHCQRCRPGGVVAQAGTSWYAAGLAARGGKGRDRAADRGGQGAGHRAGGGAGKSRLGLSGPVPARVPAEVKEAVLKSVDDAVAAGFAHTWACSLWQVSDSRVHRWRARRRDVGTLVDQAPGRAMHALLGEEIAAILDVAERWGPVDRSHRKLAHRGSYENLVWVSPATFRRVLVAHGLTLPQPTPRARPQRKPWPDWLVWAPNRIWIWDAERREALFDRTGVRDHRRRVIAVARQKLGAA